MDDPLEDPPDAKVMQIGEQFEDRLLERMKDSKCSASDLNVARLYLKGQGFISATNPNSRVPEIQGAVDEADAAENLFPFPVTKRG